ncbi:MAG TPA: ubiquinol-cytochrome c reductase iron-sulfur subunit [Acidimicrobiia bacterium]|jgi:cytochrome b6-f complex iron-sulfur subunit|nr:ubiquinol-cytochrome c reductase iron-sulfur subunit [Acidimicrobiia bacterium]
MSFSDMILIGAAVFAVIGALGAFTIAFRRSQQAAARRRPEGGPSAETLRADRSMAGVRVAPAPVVVSEPEPEPEAEPEPEPAGEPEPEPVGVRLVEVQRVIEVSPEEAGVTRRQFFNRAMNAGFFAFLGLMGMGSLSMFWPKISGGFGSDVDAGSVGDLQSQTVTPDGSVAPVFVPEARAYVVPAPDQLSDQFEGMPIAAGGLMALFQRCVHLGCRVPWCATSVGFECPCHGSKYNVIGEYFDGPAPRNLDRFAVEVQGDRFIIKTGTILETPRAQALSVNYPQGPSCIGAVADAGEH